jgi:hypothetical protein
LTFDKKFNLNALQALGIQALEPDAFLAAAIDDDPDSFREILTDQAAAWGERSTKELIDAIERAGASMFAAKARKLFDGVRLSPSLVTPISIWQRLKKQRYRSPQAPPRFGHRDELR